jgi:hypothetical protein
MNRLFFILFLIICTALNAQIGIGTTTPQGALDVNGNNTMGMVIPIVSDLSEVTTPNGSTPVNGTIVFDSTNGRLCFRLEGRWSCFGDDGNGGSAFANVYPAPAIFQTQEAYLKASTINSGDEFGYSLSISADGNTLAVGAWREASQGAVYLFARINDTWSQESYIKPSIIGFSDFFGISVALDSSGNTLAVGANREDSNSAVDPTNNSESDAGATYIFVRNGASWSQQAFLKASNINSQDQFGFAVTLSGDGNTLAVSAIAEDSNSMTDQNNNSSTNSGAVYIYNRSGSSWSQQAYIKASNIDAWDQFGDALALSFNGNTLAVGTAREDSNSVTDQSNNSASFSGAVYVYTRSGSSWTQEAYLKASNIDISDYFGWSVSLSGDGNTLAVGAWGEASGSDTNPNDNSLQSSGAVYIITRSGTVWSHEAYLKASLIGGGDQFGRSVDLSTDGNRLAIGATSEDSNNNEDQTNNGTSASGAVYVFTKNGVDWTQEDYLKASNIGSSDLFGWSVALSGDGSTLAAGAFSEDSNSATDQSNNSANNSGAVYVFKN